MDISYDLRNDTTNASHLVGSLEEAKAVVETFADDDQWTLIQMPQRVGTGRYVAGGKGPVPTFV